MKRLVGLRSARQGIWLAALLVLALAHGLAYVVVVPVWQAPDEPMLYEYAGLTAELGRIPRYDDRSPRLEEAIVRSQGRQHFWKYTVGEDPVQLPGTLDESLALFWMPRQVQGDPPLYFLLVALPLRLARHWTVEHQVLLLRLANALLLPGVVVCAYGAAREVFVNQSSIALAVAGFVALQPMFVVSSTSLSNDCLANLLGAALCWMLMRTIRMGPSLNRLIVVLTLLTIALLTKRTTLAYLIVLPGLPLLIAGPKQVYDLLTRHATRNGTWLLAGSLLLLTWAALQVDRRAASAWLNARTELPAQRVQLGGQEGAALLVKAGDEVIQPLPVLSMDALQNNEFRYGVHAWSDGEARGRLIVYIGEQRHEFPFELHSHGMPQAQLVVPPGAPNLRVGLTADHGWFYADDLWASKADVPGNLLMNGTLALPALQSASHLRRIAHYPRFKELIWAVLTGRPFSTFSYAAWGWLLFGSFWGHFGWMSVSFVLGSFWMPVLMLCSVAGIAGALRLLLRGKGAIWQWRQIALLLVLLVLAVGLILLNAYAEPSGLQQGRYLFPMLVPIALLLALGHQALIPAGWRFLWLGGWFGLWLGLAASALVHLRSYYG